MSANMSNRNDNNDRINAKKSTPTWPLIVGISVIGFSILLLTLRAIIPSLVIMLAGIFIVLYWIYITKTKSQGINSKIDKMHLYYM